MKVFPIAVQQELHRSTTRLAHFIWLRRRDGNVYGFTTATKPITIDGVMYVPAYSFNPTDVASGSNLDTDDLEAEGLLDSDTITEDDIRAGRWDFAEFRKFHAIWAAPAAGIIKDRAGHLGKITVNRQTFVAEMLGLMEAYGTSIGSLTQPGCRNNLGDRKCKVDMSGRTVSGVIETSGTDYFTLTDAARTEPDGHFDEGILVLHFPTGDISYEIKAYIVGLFVTKTAYHYDATGVAYHMTEGCPRTPTACQVRFSNMINFNGEPWLRGNDALVQIGRHK